jgi:hypothetical protein
MPGEMINVAFVVEFGPKAPLKYDVEVDWGWTLGDAFEEIREAASATATPIELMEDEDGEYIPIRFAWVGDEGEEELLDPGESLEELGLLDGATIYVSEEGIAGATGSSSAFGSAVRYHRKRFFEFLAEHERHFEKLASGPRAFRIKLNNVPGIVRIDGEGAPVIEHEHEVKIQLPAKFPMEKIRVVPVSTLFHPNISLRDKDICYSGYWPSLQDDLISWVLIRTVGVIQYSLVTEAEPHIRMNPDAANWYKTWKKKRPDYFPLGEVLRFRMGAPDDAVMNLRVGSGQ